MAPQRLNEIVVETRYSMRLVWDMVSCFRRELRGSMGASRLERRSRRDCEVHDQCLSEYWRSIHKGPSLAGRLVQ